MPSLPINEHVQRSNLGSEVVLIQLDLTKFGQGFLYLSPVGEGESGSAVSFGGQVYVPHPMELDGFEVKADGPYPTPSVVFENTGSVFTGIVKEHKNLLGAKLTRIRTFDRFLDNGEAPDPTAILSEDTYSLDEKTTHNRTQLGYKLSSAMDQQNAKLPGLTVVRDYCPWVTRTTNPDNSYDYSRAVCPYSEPQAYDENGDPCDPQDEVFSKNLETCCYPRFGKENPLPFGGWPGVARFRV